MTTAPMKIKVLMVGALPSDMQSVKGGVEAVILNLFSGFSSLDDVDVAHVAFDKEAKKQRVVNYSERVKVYFVPYQSRFPLLDYLLNQRHLSKIIKDEAPDVIHIQESEPHLIRFLNYPKHNMVVTQHGIMREELKYARGLKDNLKFLFKTWVERFVFPLFKNVIFISNYNKQLFTGRLKASRVIYNPVSPIFFSDEGESLAGGQNAILYVGVINRRKNILILLEALYQLKQIGIIYDLHVVGGYKELAFESEVQASVKRLNIIDQVTFHGWLSQHEVLKVFAHCDYFVLPSRQETLPMSVAESMALGKVVIASNVGAVSEMFHDKVTGYLFQRDDLTQLVQLLKELPSRTNPSMKHQIRSEANEKYNPVEVARQTVDFYRRVNNRQ